MQPSRAESEAVQAWPRDRALLPGVRDAPSFAQWLRDNLASEGSRPSALVLLLRLAADCADEPALRVPLALSPAQHMGLAVTELELAKSVTSQPQLHLPRLHAVRASSRQRAQ